ncbi:hypothetical protein H8E07_21150 [bacterium]|nr:hypothetical protein [bacterium]
MVIEALGVRPQITTSLTQQPRENMDTQEAEAGNVNVTPETETISDSLAGDAEGRLGQSGSNHLQEMLTHVEESVTEQIDEAREENKINEMTQTEVADKELTSTLEFQNVTDRASEEDSTDVGFVSESVLDAVNKLAHSLKFSLDSKLPLVPPAPWEATYPPEPREESGTVALDGILSPGLDKQV